MSAVVTHIDGLAVEPEVRADGRCAVCGGERRSDQKQAAMRVAAVDDPFCSSECCRAWYGVQQASDARYFDPSKQVRHQPITRHAEHGTRKGYALCACPACVAAVKGPPPILPADA